MPINVGERQAGSSVSSQIGRGRKCGDSLWNRVVNNYSSKVISSSGFGGRHLESVVNKVGRRRPRHDQVGRGRKCGGSRWNNVRMLLELKLHRPAENVRFFHRGCLWYSRSLQVLERAIFMRKRRNIRNWTLEE